MNMRRSSTLLTRPASIALYLPPTFAWYGPGLRVCKCDGVALTIISQNNNNYRTSAGQNVSTEWIGNYTQNAVKRLNSMSSGFTWNASTVYSAQQLCPYETVALGYSEWCDLFEWQEWEDFEYSIDLDFAGTYGFQSPTSRAVGVGYVEEVLARLNHHLITNATAEVNGTPKIKPLRRSSVILTQTNNSDA